MIKALFLVAAMLAGPVLAQETPPAAPAADAAAPAPAALPKCSAKVTDSCQQTAAQQARAMSGEQADKRDAAHGGKWTPDGTAATAMADTTAMPMKHHHKRHAKKVVTTTTTTETTTPAAPPQ